MLCDLRLKICLSESQMRVKNIPQRLAPGGAQQVAELWEPPQGRRGEERPGVAPLKGPGIS